MCWRRCSPSEASWGGEQSGHTIFTDLETTGDGEVTALQFLQVLAPLR